MHITLALCMVRKWELIKLSTTQTHVPQSACHSILTDYIIEPYTISMKKFIGNKLFIIVANYIYIYSARLIDRMQWFLAYADLIFNSAIEITIWPETHIGDERLEIIIKI